MLAVSVMEKELGKAVVKFDLVL